MTKSVNDTEKQNSEENTTINSKVEELINTNIAYYRLWLFKFITRSSAEFTKVFIVVIFCFFALFFLSTALALAVSYWLNSFIAGFFAVGVFFLSIVVILLLLKKSLIDKRILRKVHKLYFDD